MHRLAALEVDEVQIVVARPAALALDDKCSVVGRKAGGRAPAARREHCPRAARAEVVDDDRPVDAVVAVRRVCDRGAIGTEARVTVDEVGRNRDRRFPPVLQSPQLHVLVALVIALEQHRPRRPEEMTVHGIGAVRELPKLPAVQVDRVQLQRAGEVAANEDGVLLHVGGKRRAQLEQLP